MEITLDGDVRRVSKLLIDGVDSKKATNVVYSSLDKERPPHSVTYKHNKTILEMANKGLVKILNSKSHFQPSSTTTISEYPYYEISYQPEHIKSGAFIPFKSPNNTMSVDETLSWRDLNINISQATPQFESNSPVKIPLGSRQFKFLIYLLRNRRVVEYLEYARYAKLNCYHDECKNEDVSRDVQYIKRDTKVILKKKGVPNKFVDSMIEKIYGIGYKLANE